MPQIKHWTVSQTREVRVTAPDELTAAKVATDAFNETPDVSDSGSYAVGSVEVKDLTIGRDLY